MKAKLFTQDELDTMPQCEAHFEDSGDGKIVFVFKITGIRTVDEACALARHMKVPISASYAEFYGEAPMISSAVH
jgi:hypothetical protein